LKSFISFFLKHFKHFIQLKGKSLSPKKRGLFPKNIEPEAPEVEAEDPLLSTEAEDKLQMEEVFFLCYSCLNYIQLVRRTLEIQLL